MVRNLVAFALKNRILVVVLAAALLIVGLLAFQRLPIEAYPNPVPPLVEVITQPAGWSAEEVERYVTIPLEIGLAGMPGLDHIRSQSLFGLCRREVLLQVGHRLLRRRARRSSTACSSSPCPAASPRSISPWNAIGEVFRYNAAGQGLHAHRPQGGRGLDPGAAVASRSPASSTSPASAA